ncbi:MAG: type II toxin-antitoxin system HicB family antitoxin [Nanoarchaeota archaeon]
MKFTAILRKGEKQYVALCPEIDVVSQGYTKSEAIFNLNKAVELYLEVKYE